MTQSAIKQSFGRLLALSALASLPFGPLAGVSLVKI